MKPSKQFYINKAKTARRAPRALASQDQEPLKIVLEVDMAQYFEWLSDKIPADQLAAIKIVTSREGMNKYFEMFGIDFIFKCLPLLESNEPE